MILKEIFISDADMIPNYKNKQFHIKIHSLPTPRANESVKKLCVLLIETKTYYPKTDLLQVYETGA